MSDASNPTAVREAVRIRNINPQKKDYEPGSSHKAEDLSVSFGHIHDGQFSPREGK